MWQPPILKERGITAVVGLTDPTPLLELIGRLALRGAVQVIVGGNRFDAHQLARIVRRHTTALDATLERIQQARPFTCHQAISLLAATQPATPIIMLDMLTTFYDEAISDRESFRLTTVAVGHLRRLGQQAPVLVTLRPPPTPNRAGLVKLVRGCAQQVYIFEPPATSRQPPLL